MPVIRLHFRWWGRLCFFKFELACKIAPKVAELSRVLGTRLRDRRKAAGLTQAGLAQRCGVSTELVSRIERGRCLPSLPTLIAFARTLGCTPNELLAFEGGEASDVTALLTLLRGLPAARRREIHRIAEALASYDRHR